MRDETRSRGDPMGDGYGACSRLLIGAVADMLQLGLAALRRRGVGYGAQHAVTMSTLPRLRIK
jgi:hypothetical protein